MVDYEGRITMIEEGKLKELKESYHSYYKNYSLQFSLGLVWLSAALIAQIDIQLSILTLLMGITFLRPIVCLVSKFLGKGKLAKDESLSHMTKLTMIGIAAGMIGGFFPFSENINYFFPTFGLIFALIFACISYTGRMINFGILSLILLTGSAWLSIHFEEEFSYAGYFSGSVITFFGICNGVAGKRKQLIFRSLKKKSKNSWKKVLEGQSRQLEFQPVAKTVAGSEKVSS